MKRKATMLFAVAIAGGVATTATADPVSAFVLTPRKLATGQPACGNVMMKYAANPCPPAVVPRRTLGVQTILAIVERGLEIGRNLPLVQALDRHPESAPLTLAVADRPRS